jgi:hypothetical protein
MLDRSSVVRVDDVNHAVLRRYHRWIGVLAWCGLQIDPLRPCLAIVGGDQERKRRPARLRYRVVKTGARQRRIVEES